MVVHSPAGRLRTGRCTWPGLASLGRRHGFPSRWVAPDLERPSSPTNPSTRRQPDDSMRVSPRPPRTSACLLRPPQGATRLCRERSSASRSFLPSSCGLVAVLDWLELHFSPVSARAATSAVTAHDACPCSRTSCYGRETSSPRARVRGENVSVSGLNGRG